MSKYARTTLKGLGFEVIPQYLVAKKNPVDAGVKASFTKKDLPNTTDSFHELAIEVIHSALPLR